MNRLFYYQGVRARIVTDEVNCSMFYTVKTPWWAKRMFPGRIWEMDSQEKKIYLSFDDGPHPEITAIVLDTLKKFKAKATFFCIGKNVNDNPSTYARILNEGHAVGNHTQDHLNGWKTNDADYLDNIALAKRFIDTQLFRPPYGKISAFQEKQLLADRFKLKTIMWTVLSGDFDQKISPEKCLQNVIKYTKQGSIVVFHDSEKARKNMEYSLEPVLKYFTEKGFSFEPIKC